MQVKKTVLVTKDRLDANDHYRAQVQMPNKLVWAVLYGAISDYGADLAGDLRDKMGLHVQRYVIEHFKTLRKGSPEFRQYFDKWCQDNVADNLKFFVAKFLDE